MEDKDATPDATRRCATRGVYLGRRYPGKRLTEEAVQRDSSMHV
jgi:hypothetical protein